MKKFKRYIAIILFVVFTCQTFTFQSSARASLMSVLMAATPTEILRLNRLANSFANRIAAGSDFNAVIQRDGTSKFWGRYPVPNSFFKLEDTSGVSVGGNSVALIINKGTNYGKVKSNQSTPAGLESNVSQVDAGENHILALKEGRVYAWGSNNRGQNNVPLEALSGIIDIAAGKQHSMALAQDGRIYVWGDVSKGQNSLPNFNGENVIDIVAGYDNSLALTDAGKVYAWGGDSDVRNNIPPGIQGRTVAISVGQKHAVALLDDKTVVAWGDNSNGETNVPAGATSIVAVDAGKNHTIALKENGQLIIWGDNSSNQSEQPTDLTVNVTKALLSPTHGLVLKEGRVFAWSDNRSPRDPVCDVPTEAKSDVKDIFITSRTSAAIKNDGKLIVWGDSQIATIPDELAEYTTSSVIKVSLDQTQNHALALTETGRVIGWGSVPGKDQLPTTGATDILAGSGAFGRYTIVSINNRFRYYGDSKNIAAYYARGIPYGVMKDGWQFLYTYDPNAIRPLGIFAGDIDDSNNYIVNSDQLYLNQPLLDIKSTRVRDITTLLNDKAIYIDRDGRTVTVGNHLSGIAIPPEVTFADQVSGTIDSTTNNQEVNAVKVLAVKNGTLRIWGYDNKNYSGETEKRSYDQRYTPDYRGIDMSSQTGAVYVTVEKGQSLSFNETDFANAFISVDNQELQNIRIKSLPTGSNLKLNGSFVSVNDEISLADLSALTLETTPTSTSTTFSWQAKGADGYTGNTGQVSVVLTQPNRAPIADDLRLDIGENETFVFDQSKFDVAYTDPDAGDTYDGVIVVTVPTNATLTYNGDVVQPNAFISKATLSELKYVPNGTYAGNDIFTFRFMNKGLASGVGTCSVNVSAVNDLPELSGDLNKTVNEGDAISFSTNEFTDLYSDEEGVLPVEVKFKDLPQRNVGILMAGTTELSNDDTVTVANLSTLVFRLSRDWNGETSFQFMIKDDNDFSLPQSVTITVRAQQDPPVPVDTEARSPEDTNVSFSPNDFIITDEDNDPLEKIKITALPNLAEGQLILNQNTPSVVNVGDEIIVSNLSQLMFKPSKDFDGTAFLKWKAYDGFGYSTVDGTLSIVIEPRPDLNNFTISGAEEEKIILPKAQLVANYSLGSGDSLTKIKVTKLPKNGLLLVKAPGTGVESTSTVILNQEIDMTQLEQLIYISNLDYNGLDTFQWVGNDGQHYTTDKGQVQINVADVNDKPNVVPAYVSSEDGLVVNFTVEDFNSAFSDPEGATINAVKVIELPVKGRLKVNGTNVVEGQIISRGDLNNLVYRANTAFNGSDLFKWAGSDGEFYSKATTMTLSFLTVSRNYSLNMSKRLMTSNGISGLIVNNKLETWGKIIYTGYTDSNGNNIRIPLDDVPMSLTGIQDSQKINDMIAYINANGKVQILTVDVNRGSKWLVDLISRDPRLLNGVEQIDGGEDYLLMLSNGVVTLVSRPDKANKKVLAIDLAAKKDIVEISAGKDHALALKKDGTVVAWGDNTYGQSTVPNNLRDVVAISAGSNHSVALKNDGTVVVFGKTGNDIPPTSNNNIVNIQAGNDHTIALTKSGQVIGWGSNNEYNKITIPPSARAGVVAIESSGDHTIAIKSDNSIVGWGKNTSNEAKEFPNYQGSLSNMKLTTARVVATAGRELVTWSAGEFNNLQIPKDLTLDVDQYDVVGDNLSIVKKGFGYLYGPSIGALGGIPSIYQGSIKKILADSNFGILIDKDNKLRKWKSPSLSPTKRATVPDVFEYEPFYEVYELIEEGMEVKEIYRDGNMVAVLDMADKLHVYSSTPYQLNNIIETYREGFQASITVFENVDKVVINSFSKLALIAYKNDTKPIEVFEFGGYNADKGNYKKGLKLKFIALDTKTFDSAFILGKKVIIISGDQRTDLDFQGFRNGKATYGVTSTTVDSGTCVVGTERYFSVVNQRFDEAYYFDYNGAQKVSTIYNFPRVITASIDALINKSFRLFKGTSFNFDSRLFYASFASLDKQLKAVSMTSLPDSGEVALNGTPVRVGQEISVGNLDQLSYSATVAASSNISFNLIATDNTVIGNVRFNFEVVEAFSAEILGKRNIAIPGEGESLSEDYRLVLSNNDGVEMDEIYNSLKIISGSPAATLNDNTLSFGDDLIPTPFEIGQDFDYYSLNYSPRASITPAREASIPKNINLTTADSGTSYIISPITDVVIPLNVVVTDQYNEVMAPEITWSLTNQNSGMFINDENQLVIPAKSKPTALTVKVTAGEASDTVELDLKREESILVDSRVKWYVNSNIGGKVDDYAINENTLIYERVSTYLASINCYDQYGDLMNIGATLVPSIGNRALSNKGVVFSEATTTVTETTSGDRINVYSVRLKKSYLEGTNTKEFDLKVNVPSQVTQNITYKLKAYTPEMENQLKLVFDGFPDEAELKDSIQTSPGRNRTAEYTVKVYNGLGVPVNTSNQFRLTKLNPDHRVNAQLVEGNIIQVKANDNTSLSGYKLRLSENVSGLSAEITVDFKAEPAKLTTLEIMNYNNKLEVTPTENKIYGLSFEAKDQFNAAFAVNNGDMQWSLLDNFGNTISIDNNGQLTIGKELINVLKIRGLQQATTSVTLKYNPTGKEVTLPITISKEAPKAVRVVISGDDRITIFASRDNKVNYQSKVYSQYGELMNLPVVWTPNPLVNMIGGGVELTIPSKMVNKTISLTATVRGTQISSTKTVSAVREPAELKSIKFSRIQNDRLRTYLKIPTTGSNTYQYKTNYVSNFDEPFTYTGALDYAVEGSLPTGVSFDADNATFVITTSAELGSFTLTATADNGVKESLKLNVVDIIPFPTKIRIETNDDSDNLVWIEADTNSSKEFIVKFYDQKDRIMDYENAIAVDDNYQFSWSNGIAEGVVTSVDDTNIANKNKLKVTVNKGIENTQLSLNATISYIGEDGQPVTVNAEKVNVTIKRRPSIASKLKIEKPAMMKYIPLPGAVSNNIPLSYNAYDQYGDIFTDLEASKGKWSFVMPDPLGLELVSNNLIIKDGAKEGDVLIQYEYMNANDSLITAQETFRISKAPLVPKSVTYISNDTVNENGREVIYIDGKDLSLPLITSVTDQYNDDYPNAKVTYALSTSSLSLEKVNGDQSVVIKVAGNAKGEEFTLTVTAINQQNNNASVQVDIPFVITRRPARATSIEFLEGISNIDTSSTAQKFTYKAGFKDQYGDVYQVNEASSKGKYLFNYSLDPTPTGVAIGTTSGVLTIKGGTPETSFIVRAEASGDANDIMKPSEPIMMAEKIVTISTPYVPTSSSSGGGGGTVNRQRTYIREEKMDIVPIKTSRYGKVKVTESEFKSYQRRYGNEELNLRIMPLENSKSYRVSLPINEILDQKEGFKTNISLKNFKLTLPQQFIQDCVKYGEDLVFDIAVSEKGDSVNFKLIADRYYKSVDSRYTIYTKPNVAGNLGNYLNVTVQRGIYAPVQVGFVTFDQSTGLLKIQSNSLGLYKVGIKVPTFEDLKDFEWAENEVRILASKGIIKGITSSQFSPQGQLKRGDMVLLLNRAFNLGEAKTAYSFKDQTEATYYNNAIQRLKELGIVNGIDGDYFAPERGVKRQAAIVLIYRMLNEMGYTLDKKDSKLTINSFKDQDSVESYAREAVSTFIQAGIITGNDQQQLSPNAITTRAEVAVMLNRVMTYINN